ncbi:MAG: DUF6655 family protein [Verrucomicrobiia bacterium]|jgi:hypothetical protein
MNPSLKEVFTGVLCLSFATGCVQTRQSEPKRSAVEQLLLSRAADHAVSAAELAPLRDRKVFVDDQYFEATDGKYAIAAVRDAISQAGGLLATSEAESEVVVEVRSGALSIDSSNSLVGIPEIPVPIPFSGTLQSPEVRFYKSEKQFSLSKLALLAIDTKSRKHLFSTGVLFGKSHHHYYTLFGFFRWISTDLPAKK